MADGDRAKWFDAIRLADRKQLAGAHGVRLPQQVFEAAVLTYLSEDCSVAIRANGETILQIHSHVCYDCPDCESDPELQRVDLRISPNGWGP
jgi:hypothetical protein